MLRFPAKKLRTEVIARYCREADYRGVVCFSCGNASKTLREAGLYVVDISPSGSLSANQWWAPAEIHRAWPDLLDATSGHLTIALMLDIARSFKSYLGDLPDGIIEVPSGSGETIVCLSMAYPDKQFRPVYNLDNATEYHPRAPLNGLVRLIQTAP